MIWGTLGREKADLSSRSELVQSTALPPLPQFAISYALSRAPLDKPPDEEVMNGCSTAAEIGPVDS
jgi:hypothetical protein